MNALWQDLSYGIRMLLKKPGFTVVAVLTLALGIGANAAIFSVVNAIVLKPTPYLNDPRLVFISSGDKQTDPQGYYGASPADFLDWHSNSKTFQQLAAYSPDGGLTLTGVERPEFFRGNRVSTNFFQVFGVKPLLGRSFLPEDGLVAAPKTILLSYGLWQRRFGGDPAIIGQSLGNTGVTVIGVMPPDFKYPTGAECWTPLARDANEMRTRANRYFSVVGSIKPDQTLESAQAEIKAIAAQLEVQYPGTNKNITVQVTSIHELRTRGARQSLLVLLGAVGCVLLVACANIANLLLARAGTRRKEMAIRLALGASRRQLLRQLLTESLLLAALGGAMGLLLGLWGLSALMRLLPEGDVLYFQLQERLGVDQAVLSFTLLISLLTGIFFGLAPAWQASNPAVNDELKEGGRGSDGARRQRLRSALVVSEIALAMVLLVGAGLLAGSFVRKSRVDLGFDAHRLFSTGMRIMPGKFPDDESRARYMKQMLDQVSQTPGVESAVATSGWIFPFLHLNFNIPSRPLPAAVDALYETVSPNYFRALRARLLAGREFDERDDTRSPAVAIINQTLARRYFGGEDPLNKRLSIVYFRRPIELEIVGVVADMNQGELGEPIIPQIYVPYLQRPWPSSGDLVVRAAHSDLSAVKKDVQRAILAVDRDQVFIQEPTAEEGLDYSLAGARFKTVLLVVFAALALSLAAVGIYGVMSYTVAERTREIGIRVALGAQAGAVLKMVIGQGMKLAMIGVGVGVVAALALTRLIKSSLYGVSATDPMTFIAIGLVIMAVALLACWIPARRATKVDPMVALRVE
jgi:putative ABC transport system permease protein